MIMKTTFSKIDDMVEVREITKYYTETDYLEAEGVDFDEIIVSGGEHYVNEKMWEVIEIFTDTGFELLKMVNEAM